MNKPRTKFWSAMLALILAAVCACSFVLVACAPSDPGPGPGPDDSATVESLVLDASGAKTTFAYGEEFTYDGLKVTAKMSDGSEKEVPTDECRISAPSMSSPGQRRVTVSYGGKSAQYTITVQERVIPDISSQSLVDIVGENESAPYRVEAENIDMETPGVKLADGYDAFVADAAEAGEGEEEIVVSGDKYLTGYGVTGNYFGFTFTADKAYQEVTMVLRVSAPADEAISLGEELALYLNYESDETTHGQISLEGMSVAAGAQSWADVVIRGLSIPAGTNELTFDVLGEVAVDLDYIDFYVGARYISSVVELTEEVEDTLFIDLEDIDSEKAYTRPDFAAAHGWPEDRIFLETVSNEAQAANTSRGTSVAALATGSQLSTTLRLGQDATVELKIKVASVEQYIVKDNWSFLIDGYTLNGVDDVNIQDGNPGANEYWLWKEVSLGIYNLTAGDHLFQLNVVGGSCNIDGLFFDVISYGSFDESGVDIDKQPEAEPDPEAALTKNGVVRLEAENLRYRDGWVMRDDATSFTESWNRGGESGVCLKGFTAESEIKAVIEVQEATTVSISFRMSYYDSETFDFGKSVITLAGQPLTATAEGAFGHDVPDDYWKWNTVNLGPVEVEAGVHTLSIVFNDKGMNLDYFEFVGGDGSDFVSPDEDAADIALSVGETGRVEAESTDSSGWIKRDDWSETTSFTEAWSNDMGSGSSLKGMGAGSVVTFRVELRERATVTIKAPMSYYDAETYDFAANTAIELGGQALTATPGGPFGHRNETDWWNWVQVDLGSVTLDAGTYTFTMTFIAEGLNIDYFELTASAAQ